MKSTKIIPLTCLTALPLVSSTPPLQTQTVRASHPQASRPNIILFVVDDMGVMDTSLPFLTDGQGHPQRHPLNDWYRTPNMERLAAQGTRFETFYAQSVSSPSRVSIMTGQNAARHRTTNWINTESDNRTIYGPAQWNWQGIHDARHTLPQVLKDAGYHTIHVGKAHFGCQQSIGANPTKIGFDVNIAGSSIGQPGSYLGVNGYGWIKGRRDRAVPDLEKYHGTDIFLTDALTIEACNQIKQCLKSDKPFFINMAHYAVHAPFEADQRFLSHYPPGSKDDQARAFATLIEGMDRSLGTIMDSLRTWGIAQNTLIIFIGDNGSDAPLGKPDAQASSAPLRGKKGAEYEGGTRVPFIAAWAKPESGNPLQRKYPIAVNHIQTQMGTIMDLYPTLLQVASARTPKDYVTDGSALWPMLNGIQDKHHRRDFLMHFPHGEHRANYFTTYRNGDWKIIYYYNPETDGKPTCRLYNLKSDPYENHDVHERYPHITSRLCRQMISRLQEEHALYPIDKQGKTLFPVVL